MKITAYLGPSGLTDIGYRFYDSEETALGDRVTEGVLDAGDGWYSANVVPSAGAASVRWDSAGDPEVKAREYFDLSLTGTRSVSLLFVDQADTPVPFVEFSVVGHGSGRAGSDGVATFGLFDGSYTVVPRATSGALFQSTAITVNGDVVITITAQSIAVPPPTSPSLCRVYGYIYRPDGSLAKNVEVRFTLKSTAKTTAGAAIHNVVVTAQVGEDGYLDVELLRNDAITPAGSSYAVTISDRKAFPTQAVTTTALADALVVAGATLDVATVAG